MADSDDLPPPYEEHAAPRQMGTLDHFDRWDDGARSMPALQFEFQIELEKERMLRHFRPGGKQMKSLPMDPNSGLNRHVLHNIRARWKQWGIWDDNWEVTERFGHWMHEDLDAKGKSPQTWAWGKPPTDWEPTFDPSIRYTTKPVDESILNGSRPINQFRSQVAHERDYLEETGLYDLAHNTRTLDEQARENVRHRWNHQKIWSPKWRDVPGNSWDHELVDLGPQAQYFYKRNRFSCYGVADSGYSLPSNKNMWFRKEPGGSDHESIRAPPKAPKIVPCNCMPLPRRRALKEHPIVSTSEPRVAPDQQTAASTQNLRKRRAAVTSDQQTATSARNVKKRRVAVAPAEGVEGKAKTARPKRIPKSPASQQSGNGELRRSLRLKQKEEQVKQKQIKQKQQQTGKKAIANKPKTKKQRTGKKSREKKINANSTKRSPQRRQRKR